MMAGPAAQARRPLYLVSPVYRGVRGRWPVRAARSRARWRVPGRRSPSRTRSTGRCAPRRRPGPGPGPGRPGQCRAGTPGRPARSVRAAAGAVRCIPIASPPVLPLVRPSRPQAGHGPAGVSAIKKFPRVRPVGVVLLGPAGASWATAGGEDPVVAHRRHSARQCIGRLSGLTVPHARTGRASTTTRSRASAVAVP